MLSTMMLGNRITTSISTYRAASAFRTNHTRLNRSLVRQLYNTTPTKDEQRILSPQDLAGNPRQQPKQGKSVWSVLPYWRQRSPATTRLWLSRYLDSKEKAHQDSSSTNTPVARKILQKRMSDSYVELYLPFKSDPLIKEEYVNFYGGVRLSKVFEDLDALSGSIAYLHCDDGDPATPPLTIVTASVDRIDLLDSLSLNEDYKLSGFVTYVGTSSMEVSIKMTTVPEGEVIPPAMDPYSADVNTSMNNVDTTNKKNIKLDSVSEKKSTSSTNSTAKHGKPLLVAKFTMVARDPSTNKSSPINQLQLITDEERRLFRLGAEHKARKAADAQLSLTKQPPSYEESKMIHSLYLEFSKYLDPKSPLPKPNDIVWMSETHLETHVLTMPQDRNIHGFVFGGYLMRLAYEIAYTNACVFSRCRPYFLSLDDIIFRKPVQVGSLLNLTSTVDFAAGYPHKTFQVTVKADVVDTVTGSRDTTNVFSFTFFVDEEQNGVGAGQVGKKLRRVLPQSYEEAMRYLAGKRRKEAALQFAEHNKSVLGHQL